MHIYLHFFNFKLHKVVLRKFFGPAPPLQKVEPRAPLQKVESMQLHSAVKHCAVQIVHCCTMLVLIYEILMVENLIKFGPDIIKQTTAGINGKKRLSGKIQQPQVNKLGKVGPKITIFSLINGF